MDIVYREAQDIICREDVMNIMDVYNVYTYIYIYHQVYTIYVGTLHMLDIMSYHICKLWGCVSPTKN